MDRHPGGHELQSFRLHLKQMDPNRVVILQWSERDVTARLFIDRKIIGQSSDTYALQTTDDHGRRINLTWGYHVDGVLWVKQDHDYVRADELPYWDLKRLGAWLRALGWATLPLLVLVTDHPLLILLAMAATGINMGLMIRAHTAYRTYVITGLISTTVFAVALAVTLWPKQQPANAVHPRPPLEAGP